MPILLQMAKIQMKLLSLRKHDPIPSGGFGAVERFVSLAQHGIYLLDGAAADARAQCGRGHARCGHCLGKSHAERVDSCVGGGQFVWNIGAGGQ
jgi:hypothetical protein